METFKLPIDYLETQFIHRLPDVVINDLELVDASATSPMYNVLLKPSHVFAKNMIHKWKKSYSSDVEFIEQTQQVIKNTLSKEEEVVDADCLNEIWKDLYETPSFHDRYNYIDVKQFHFVNEQSTFMGFWTIINLLSPAFSILLPLILMVAPFVLLKIQGVPINFNTYLSTLLDLAKKHTIGKALTSIGDFSFNNMIYLLFTVAMYGLQMYQNVKSCIRFYNNISSVNTNLLKVQRFVNSSISNMEEYLRKNSNLSKYKGFCEDVSTHHGHLVSLREELKDVKPFSFGVSKCFEVGYLLKCYYCLHSVKEYKMGFEYAMAFEGYHDNLQSLASNINSETIHFGKVGREGKTRFVKQVYPALADSKPIENNISLENNLIISGPNASGKTTQLKTTAINIIFTQQFGVGFYKTCNLVPYTHIHSYLNIPDTSGRDSLFQAEARRCKEILDIIDEDMPSKHFCIFDELFSGTNAEEATAASYGFLKYLQKHENVDFILTTHFMKLCKKVKNSKNLRIENYKMDAELIGDNISFSYKLVKGISKIKAARLILLQMGFPKEIYERELVVPF